MLEQAISDKKAVFYYIDHFWLSGKIKIPTLLFLLAVLLLIFAPMFSIIEDWNFFESMYYCIITLTTIGNVM